MILIRRPESITDKCIGEYQSDLKKGKSTTDQLAIVEQIVEKNTSLDRIYGEYLSTLKRRIIAYIIIYFTILCINLVSQVNQ